MGSSGRKFWDLTTHRLKLHGINIINKFGRSGHIVALPYKATTDVDVKLGGNRFLLLVIYYA